MFVQIIHFFQEFLTEFNDLKKHFLPILVEKVTKLKFNLKKIIFRFYRRTDWMIAATCFAIVFGIYSYTIFAIQQEQFLDDFDMPEDIDRIKEEDK